MISVVKLVCAEPLGEDRTVGSLEAQASPLRPETAFRKARDSASTE